MKGFTTPSLLSSKLIINNDSNRSSTSNIFLIASIKPTMFLLFSNHSTKCLTLPPRLRNYTHSNTSSLLSFNLSHNYITSRSLLSKPRTRDQDQDPAAHAGHVPLPKMATRGLFGKWKCCGNAHRHIAVSFFLIFSHPLLSSFLPFFFPLF